MKLFIAIAISFLTVAGFTATPVHAQTGKSKADGAAITSQRKVEYADLEKHVGSRIVIETIHNTTRSGTLMRYTNVALTMQLGAEAGAIELSVPRSTVRSISLAIGAADPLFPNDTFKQEAATGAKKN
ncbi:MAG: hypothetical protein ABI650_06250 [Dokdonella sp.]